MSITVGSLLRKVCLLLLSLSSGIAGFVFLYRRCMAKDPFHDDMIMLAFFFGSFQLWVLSRTQRS